MNTKRMLIAMLAMIGHCLPAIAMAESGLPAKPLLDTLTVGPLARVESRSSAEFPPATRRRRDSPMTTGP